MIYADISEFVSNPIGTGIQRTIRAIFRHWTDGLTACYFDKAANNLRVLTPEALAAVLDNSNATTAEKADRAARSIAAAPGTLIGDEAYVLIPELFWDHARCAFYKKRIERHPSRSFAIVYDLFPWMHPRDFGITDRTPFEPYFNLVFSMAYTAHISQETKEAYEIAGRLRRPWPLPILHLGADGLSVEKQTFHPSRKTFVCLGSIEARKRQSDVLMAFEGLWDEGVEVDLVFVGKLVDHGNASLGPAIEAAKERYPQFSHYPAASDEQLAQILSTARATILASTLEGYGIPPVESLYAGIPVIVSDVMPSTRRLQPLGQIRIEPKRPDRIAAAARKMLDNDEARRLWTEAASISLPTWRDTARQVREWATHIEIVHSAIDRDLARRDPIPKSMPLADIRPIDLDKDASLQAESARWLREVAT
ncbi:glycosyltransferase [Mesorhizobium carmichaelinearum]|uniref:glycosyltransferase n=1 Tax=Mesorhizobium carmichaelinearum TaxID=1208188 RepID=UPI000BA4715F|nr:glycosyltransferase [Mesorhizobium carmichaelinearum]